MKGPVYHLLNTNVIRDRSGRLNVSVLISAFMIRRIPPQFLVLQPGLQYENYSRGQCPARWVK